MNQTNGGHVFVALFAAFVTVYLGGPPVLQIDLARKECAEIVVDRVHGDRAAAHARWNYLPFARWTCEMNGTVVADMGWFVTASTSASVQLLIAPL